MKKYLGAIVLLAASNASALDLDQALIDRDNSLSGETLRSVRTNASIRRASLAAQAKPLVTRLNALASTTWNQVRNEARLTLRNDKAELGTSAKTMGEKDVLSKAAELRDALRKTAFADEDLIAIQTGGSAITVADAQGKVASQSITGHRVIYRRYLQGVPVLGRDGEVDAWWNAAGELVEVDLPTARYSVSSARGAVANGVTAAVTGVRRAQFDRLPVMDNDVVSYAGTPFEVHDFQCGYYDDGESQTLRVGCLVTGRSLAGMRSVFAPVD